MKKLLFLILILPITLVGQITNRLIVTQNVPLDISANNYMFTVPPNDNRIYVAKMDSLKLHAYNIVDFTTSLYLKGDTRYKSITYSPSFVEIISGLGFNPYPASNPSGYISSYTETDPLVPAYSKTLNAFSVIKSSTDPLYKAIGYTPTSLEITTALGFTPVTNARTLTINGTAFDLSVNRSWTVGDVTTANLTSGLATKENTITAGTTAQYWRGDKTWQTLDKTAVGLGNVDNTSDLNKGISTATQTSLNSKQDLLVSGTNIKTVGGVSILGSGNIAVGSGTVTSITAGTGLSGGTITTSGTISLPNTGIIGTYNTVTTDAQGRIISGTVSTPSSVTVALNTSSKISTTQATRVSYTVTHTIGLTLLLTSGSSMAYLEISPDNSTWTTISQAGYSDGVAVAVALTKTVTNNVQGEVPANYFRRIRVVTSGAGSAAYTCGQETIF